MSTLVSLDNLRGKTLLVVDDEPDLREPLVIEFESLGCRVLQAANGKDAFEIVKKEKVDAVISDIRMPGGDGIELLRNIKELHHEFPMVMLITGFSDLSREDAYHLGAEAILSKPFDLDELDRAVSRILQPPEERWEKPTDPKAVKNAIEAEFADFSDALKKGAIRFGRGGIFFRQTAGQPYPGHTVAIKIRFATGDILSLEGTGIVRWVRREDTPTLPQGTGIEFDYLDGATREKVLKFVAALKLKEFIPRA